MITVPPSDRTPRITVKRGRVLHRVGTHNKPMTRRELGAAFAGGGDLFAVEFGLMRGYGTTAVKCELVPPFGSNEWGLAVMNVGLLPALDITIASAKHGIRWDVVLICLRDEYADPIQDVLIVTWKTPDGQVHRNQQSWSWTPRWAPPARTVH